MLARVDQADGAHLKLAEALSLAAARHDGNPTVRRVWLACGFTPLHLVTYLKARALTSRREALDIRTGVFGDLPGNLALATADKPAECAVIVEWADLDPRLGFRHAGGWGPSLTRDIESEAGRQIDRLIRAIAALAETSAVALCGPTLPLPPIGHTAPSQETAFELRLRAAAASFLARAADIQGVRVLSQAQLALESPAGERLDAAMDLATGFPYTVPHTDSLAKLLIQALFPPPAKKGLITDLDDTFWRGIVGEVGVEGVCWDLQNHAQHHGLYQQFLAALAERGVLIAVASKNDPALVAQALGRSDLLAPQHLLFPVEVSWGAKSAAVSRILSAWNIAASDVVFVDDSPMEAAEVQAAHPDMTCLAFPRSQPGRVPELLRRLRDLFGRQHLVEEDRLRAASLRGAEAFRQESGAAAPDEFLSGLHGTVTIDFTTRASDPRALELINKTNQFNLNGRRITEGEWRIHLAAEGSFLAVVSYEDKFGPLGKIAVVTGTTRDGAVAVSHWVMSCRAFSRRIEHHTLDRLLAHFAADRVELDYCPTERNGPLSDFLRSFTELPACAATVVITAGIFEERRPALPHAVRGIGNGSDRNATSGMLLEGVP